MGHTKDAVLYEGNNKWSRETDQEHHILLLAVTRETTKHSFANPGEESAPDSGDTNFRGPAGRIAGFGHSHMRSLPERV